MTNNQKETNKDYRRPESTENQEKKDSQKKYDQGKGVVSTTDPDTENKEKKPDQKDAGLNEQSKITNQDPKITNKDGNDAALNQDKTAVHDDEDVDEKGNTGKAGIDEPEIETPVRNPEETKRKIPKMTK
jgi:hypothetical protein